MPSDCGHTQDDVAMSVNPPNEGTLSDHHNVARHCGEQAISEFNGLPKAAAFKLRDDETYLSVNWLECFHEHNFDIALIGIRCAMTRNDRTIGARSQFATLNVGNARNAIYQKLEYVPQIIRKVKEFDESHAGIYVRREKAGIVAFELAKQVRRTSMYSGKGYEL